VKRDPFSCYHPLVNFLYFVGVLGLGVVIQHPVYVAVSALGGGVYYFLLKGRKGVRPALGMLALAALIALVNPLFNTLGQTPLFYLFGKPYSYEALVYGLVVGGMFLLMLLWFGCYSQVLTSDKFTSLFGSFIPALSLLLVMVLRLIPNLIRKIAALSGARRSIGKGAGEQSSRKEGITEGVVLLSALTDWSLEGSLVTADSMRSRGYGTAKRTSFQIYRMSARDWVMLALILLLAALTLTLGSKTATFVPQIQVEPLNFSLLAYGIYLLIPTALHIKEAIVWRILRSKI
jgi:energy-coupling factor transport system permease protein